MDEVGAGEVHHLDEASAEKALKAKEKMLEKTLDKLTQAEAKIIQLEVSPFLISIIQRHPDFNEKPLIKNDFSCENFLCTSSRIPDLTNDLPVKFGGLCS